MKQHETDMGNAEQAQRLLESRETGIWKKNATVSQNSSSLLGEL